MALSSEDVRTQIESPNTQQIVPVMAHVSDLIELDPHSELFLETPPPDVVSSINACFEQFTSTLERRRDASVHKSSDSDSGESLFVTQSVTKAVRTARQHTRSTKRPVSISDDTGDDREGVTSRLLENEDSEYEEGSEGQHAVSPNRGKRIDYVPPQKATFPFLLKSHRRRHLPLKKHQILENSEIGGFLKCIKKLNEGYVKTGRAISPYMLESELSDNSEEDDHSSDHEVTKVDKTIFVPSYKGNTQKWLTQSILEKRIQDSLSKDNEEQLLNVNGKENKRKSKSTKKNKTSASVKKQSEKKRKVPKSKAIVRTLSESSCVSLFEEQEKHEIHEVLASCSDAEDLDSSNCGQPLNYQIIQCAKNLHGSNFVAIETQRHSVESVTQKEQEDDMRSGTDNRLPNKSYFFFPPQGGDISVQNEIQQTDSDIGSVDLFSPLNSQNPKNNQIHKTASITANMEEGDQDSDVTQIETEGQFDSVFGLGTPRWCDGERHGCEDDESDITQLEMEGESVSVFEPRPRTKQFTIQDVNHTKHSESHKTGPSPAVLHTELMSREDKTRHKNKKRKSMLSSHKDTEVTGIETVNVQLSSKHLTLADEPLREVYSSSCEHFIVGKQRTMVEIETDTQDSPLFKNGGISFLKRKRKGKKKMGATILIECDSNVDASQIDVTELKTCRENGELCDVEKRVINEEKSTASVLQSEETAELLEEIIVSMVADSTVNKKAKRKKMKMDKLKEREYAEPGVENQSVEAVQFSEPQTTELTLKRKKKKRKDKEGTKTAYVEENSATDIPSNETLDSDRLAELRVNEGNQSSEAPETGQLKHMQTSEEVTGCPSLNVTRLKSVKKKKKKKRDETEESQYESVDLNASSMSQFDAGLRVVEQQEDQVIEERWSNDNAAEYLEGNTAIILKVPKNKKKSQNVSSPSQIDDIIGLEKQVSGMQSENIAEPNHLGSDDNVITKDKQKKAKKQKLKERQTIELASDIKDIMLFQYSESQTTDLLSRRTKKRANNDRERTTISSSNELLEHMDESPPEMRGNNVIHSTEANQTKHLQSSEGITRYPSPSVTRFGSGKKKKKKRDRSDECPYESVDLNLEVSSLFQFDAGLRVVEQQEDQVIEERRSNDNAAQHLEGNTASILKVAKHKKRSQNASSLSEIDDIIGLAKQVSGMQSESTAEPNHLGSDDIVITKDTQKKTKKQKLKERKTIELASDIKDIMQFQYSESQTTDLLSRRTKKKRANNYRDITTVSSPNELLEHMDDRPPEMRGNNMIHSTEANQTQHLQSSEGITRKKKDRSKRPYESVDLNLDASSVSQFDVIGLSAQKMIERRQSNAAEYLDCYSAHILNVARRKKKSQNASSPSQVDDLIGLENAVLDLQSGNTAELEEKINLSVLSDNALCSKYKQNKKKKHKLKEQVDAESNAVIHSMDNVHLVETDQFNESQTTELTLKRTKKKRREKDCIHRGK